jgi:riboflavin kinase/FMN adenylyltransferase
MASRVVHWQDHLPAECQGGAVAVGNFDGAHRGHAALVAQLRRHAHEAGGPAVAVTFAPHPIEVLHPGARVLLLTTPEDRADLLHALGTDHVITLRTTPDLLALGPADFFAFVLRDRLRARHLVEGANFRFGHDRAGDVHTLAALCAGAGVGLSVVEAVGLLGGEVSSSRIRACLQAGDVAGARELLGRDYRIHGTVVTGARRGRTIGFPTANLGSVPTVVPGEGVYAVRAFPPGGEAWPAAANVGPAPTFGEQERRIEVHLIGFTGDLYGRELGVEFVARLRDTRPFSGVAELVAQLHRDVAQAQEALA